MGEHFVDNKTEKILQDMAHDLVKTFLKRWAYYEHIKTIQIMLFLI